MDADLRHSYDPDQRPAGARRELLARVPRGACVLDIGCWSGWAGRHLIRENAATVDGIEPNAEMAERAAIDYREVLQSDADDAVPRLLARNARYDTLLLLDVLEHLPRPEAFLQSVGGLLAPGGRALVSVPNVAHWWVRKELLRGRFRYTDSGILDRTHLRLFTLETTEELLRESGWDVVWAGASLDRPPVVPLRGRGLRLLSRWPGLFAAQGLFEAQPKDS
jgi:2-polyprenyl-3-methyl-5-hydroxy-6-metoxy-1,4-benzoquinol methylase